MLVQVFYYMRLGGDSLHRIVACVPYKQGEFMISYLKVPSKILPNYFSYMELAVKNIEDPSIE